jgi:hypothetical protein
VAPMIRISFKKLPPSHEYLKLELSNIRNGRPFEFRTHRPYYLVKSKLISAFRYLDLTFHEKLSPNSKSSLSLSLSLSLTRTRTCAQLLLSLCIYDLKASVKIAIFYLTLRS